MNTGTARSRAGLALLVAAIVGVALNQRPAVVSVSPLLGVLRSDTGLSAAMAGLLTTVPVLCFGAFAPLAPRLARRVGLETAVGLSLALLAGGIALRLLPPLAALYAGSLVAGASIALANVLLPAYVKREFVRPGAAMGVYTASLNVGAALGAAVTVPLATALGLGWRAALGMWGVVAVAALALWLPVAGTGRAHRGVGPDVAGGGSWGLLRQPLARQVTLYLGMQSVQFYAMVAWLPTLLADNGVPVREGGVLLGVSNVIGAAAALVAPVLAGRMRTQRPLVLVVGAFYVAGMLGLALAPGAAPVLWITLFGVAQGGGFALALTLIVLRSPTPLVAARLGGVAQCLGYLLAGAGPLVLGALHDVTGGWMWPVLLLVVLLVPMTWVGWYAGCDAVLDVACAPTDVDLPTTAPAAG